MFLHLFFALLAPPISAPLPKPRLVVFIAIDQMRGDYLDRYQREWTGGFKRMLDRGSFFPNARQDHGVTETAPGHSTLLSGRTPSHTGIVNNTLGVFDSTAPLIGVSGPGASPWRFQGTTLVDWIRKGNREARVLSISRKDRGAILPVGGSKADVYWYLKGQFTTSRYYADTLPLWVTAFNNRHGAERLAGTTWNLLRPASQYREPDSMPFEHGKTDVVFPHHLPSNAVTAAAEMPDYPWMDSLTLDLALEGAKALELGSDSVTDLLSISLSATDGIGHSYGPDSRELHDQLLRLDHWLGWFLDSLAKTVPPGEVVFALSADHGVQSFPEFNQNVRHRPGGRVSLADVTRDVRRQLSSSYGSTFDLDEQSGLVTANATAMRQRGINVDSLAESIAVLVRAKNGVSRVLTPATMAHATPSDSIAELWRRDIPVSQGWLIAGALESGFMWADSDGWTTHGSLNMLDMSVPIVFWGSGVKHGRSERVVSSVDIAPTLAALIGVTPDEPLDGHVLAEVLALSPAGDH
jgi:Type I phosphodiesterase / nucleotide pyrophosphatase